MENIKNLIETLKSIQISQIIDILIGILIFILFKCLSKSLAYITVKIMKPKIKNRKEIKRTPFYNPLTAFYIILGAYIGILFIKEALGINEKITAIVNKVFRIAIIIIVSNGLANSLTTKSKILNKIKERVNPEVDDTMYNFTLKIIKFIIYIISGFLVITELGYDLNGLVAGLGIGSVVITLAAQDTAKNLFGGLVIFLDKPFVVGDWIEVEKYEGTVEDITFRSTRVNLCLDLETPLEKVQIVQNRIRELLKQHDDVIDETIIVRFDNITDNGINLMISSYTNSIDYASFIEEKEKINFKIMQILREEKVELAYDTKTVFLRS